MVTLCRNWKPINSFTEWPWQETAKEGVVHIIDMQSNTWQFNLAQYKASYRYLDMIFTSMWLKNFFKLCNSNGLLFPTNGKHCCLKTGKLWFPPPGWGLSLQTLHVLCGIVHVASPNLPRFFYNQLVTKVPVNMSVLDCLHVSVLW